MRILWVFWLLLGIQVIETAEELIESMHRRQEFVQVTQMVLAELARHVSLLLEQIRDGGVFRLKS